MHPKHNLCKLFFVFLNSFAVWFCGVAHAQDFFALNTPPQQEYLPSSLISLGKDMPTYALVVEKKKHLLTVFQLLKDGQYAVVKKYSAITGKEQGDKKFRGDNRTPEGIYFVIGRKEGGDLVKKWGKDALKYGPRAFVLDYPNIFDRTQRKTGSGIWIHGVKDDTRILKPFDTEGCVALANADVLDVSKYISHFETPVVIVDEMKQSTLDDIEQKREDVLTMLELWRQSWVNSEFSTYLDFYADEFSVSGHTKETWKKMKSNLAKNRGQSIQVQIGEPKILAFKDQILVQFLQKYTSDDKVDFGRKFLYLQPSSDGLFQIVSEKWYPVKDPKYTDIALGTR